MVFFPLQMHIIHQFIDEYDICNVLFFLQSIVFKDMVLKLEFFDAVRIMFKNLPLPRKKLNVINYYIARLKLKTLQR